MRARILIFLAALLADAVIAPPQPWPLVIAVVVYLAVVFPALGR